MWYVASLTQSPTEQPRIYSLVSDTGELVCSIDTAIATDTNGKTGSLHPRKAIEEGMSLKPRVFQRIINTSYREFQQSAIVLREATKAEIIAAGFDPSVDDDNGVVFRNESGLEFQDISSELERTYNFGNKGFVRIQNPLKLNVSDSGGHRLFSADGKSHYVPSGWMSLTWTAKANQPNFVK